MKAVFRAPRLFSEVGGCEFYRVPIHDWAHNCDGVVSDLGFWYTLNSELCSYFSDVTESPTPT